jgi:hypothetical protein
MEFDFEALLEALPEQLGNPLSWVAGALYWGVSQLLVLGCKRVARRVRGDHLPVGTIATALLERLDLPMLWEKYDSGLLASTSTVPGGGVRAIAVRPDSRTSDFCVEFGGVTHKEFNRRERRLINAKAAALLRRFCEEEAKKAQDEKLTTIGKVLGL